MEKKELIALGLTEEQANKVLEENGKDVGKAITKHSVDKAEFDRLKGIETELEAERTKNLTAEEKLQQAVDAAKEKETDFLKKTNKLDVEKILIAAGITEEEYKDYIDDLVTDNSDLSKKLANGIVSTVTKQKESAIQKTKEELLDGTPKPGANGGEGGADEKDEAVELAKSLASARAVSNEVSKSAAEYYGGK